MIAALDVGSVFEMETDKGTPILALGLAPTLIL